MIYISEKIYTENKSLIPPLNIYVLLKIYCCWTGVFCMILRAFAYHDQSCEVSPPAVEISNVLNVKLRFAFMKTVGMKIMRPPCDSWKTKLSNGGSVFFVAYVFLLCPERWIYVSSKFKNTRSNHDGGLWDFVVPKNLTPEPDHTVDMVHIRKEVGVGTRSGRGSRTRPYWWYGPY